MLGWRHNRTLGETIKQPWLEHLGEDTVMRYWDWKDVVACIGAGLFWIIGGIIMAFCLTTSQDSLGAKRQLDDMKLIRQQSPIVTMEYVKGTQPLTTKGPKVQSAPKANRPLHDKPVILAEPEKRHSTQ